MRSFIGMIWCLVKGNLLVTEILDIPQMMQELGFDAKRASRILAIASTEKKNEGFVYSELVPTSYEIDMNESSDNQLIQYDIYVPFYEQRSMKQLRLLAYVINKIKFGRPFCKKLWIKHYI